MICAMCGRTLKGIESIERGYGPVCYRRINPPAEKKRLPVEHCDRTDDVNYNLPGQMQLSDFMKI